MEYPFPRWRGKPVLFSKHASEEIMNDNVAIPKILETLEGGIETKEKRKKGVLEVIKGFKDEVLKVVIAERDDCWFVITVIKFRR
jgi:hypothetical protein